MREIGPVFDVYQCSSSVIERFMLIFTVDGRQIFIANIVLFSSTVV